MEVDAPQEGFPADIFAQTVPDVMVCPICHGVMRQAVTFMCRGSHKACETCCQQWVKQMTPATVLLIASSATLSGTNSQCVARRSDSFLLLVDHPVTPTVAQRPCEWQGKLEDLARHQTQECSQRVVGCSHPGCTHRCPACALPGHLDACEWKPVPCEKCLQMIARKELPAHLGTVCPAVEAPCPDCHQPFQRSALDAHRAQCPEAPLPCTIPGCDAKITRCRMADHLATASAQHLACLQVAFERTKAESDTTKEALAQSLAAQQRLQDEVDDLTVEIIDLEEEVNVLRQQAPSRNALVEQIRALLISGKCIDLASDCISLKIVRQSLEEYFGMDLTALKGTISEIVKQMS
ncbi:hypothetical protein PAPYR_1654 [Paratrimastix pyriformis]|uniref:TRAF-type domain-containing protein n=1 Tax=Paratrimastix pyriformis TaxID=342808 RepID=A0ABQ8US42_9EUKA|nr:hypothetical protein PAPYR_1654 [Paratrimastix pyriformis]